MARNSYESPLSARYASGEMKYLFSPDMKFRTWRKLWIALAETELELGLPVTKEQVEELKAHAEDINYEVAEAREKVVRHDVMSHVYAYGQQCPKAAGIIHLGATSCYVGDNTDVIVMTEAMKLLRDKLIGVLRVLRKFAEDYKNLPTLAFTHFQPAQPTTVGKRATLWMQDLLMDLEDVEYQLSKAKLLGCKGTTGTQASFLELFEGDHEKCRELDRRIAEKMGYEACFPVSGQTYSRISVPEAFLAVDGILNLYANVADGLVVYPKVIEQHMLRELPFMATENIMMDAAKRGADRQELHERIRVHSMAAARVVKEEGGENDLLERIAGDPIFGVTLSELSELVKPEKYVGRAPRQTEEFLAEVIKPVLEKYSFVKEETPEIKV